MSDTSRLIVGAFAAVSGVMSVASTSASLYGAYMYVLFGAEPFHDLYLLNLLTFLVVGAFWMAAWTYTDDMFWG